jgi:hypothetical protein
MSQEKFFSAFWRRHRRLLIALALIAAGAALRLTQITGALEYDEIWTLESYSRASFRVIFTDLSLPNNHPLNSLAVKLMRTLHPGVVAMRLPSLLAGILAIPAVGLLALLLFRRRGAALWAMFLIAFSAPLAAYSQTARGYSMQFLFCVLFGIGLALPGRFRPIRCRLLPEALLLLGGVGAILTLPTSILYLAPAALAAVWPARRFRRPDFRRCRPTIIVFLLGGIFTLFWYGVNFRQFRAAQGWGLRLEGIGAYADWLVHLFGLLSIWPVMLAAAVGAALVRRSRKLLLVAAFPVLGAWFTHAGPPRAYLVLIAVIALLAAAGIDRLLRQLVRRGVSPGLQYALIALLVLGVIAGFYRQKLDYPPTDWYAMHRDATEFPREALLVFPANNSYPLAWNNAPAAAQDFFWRLTCPDESPRFMLLTGNGTLNGADFRGGEQQIPVGFPGEAVRNGMISGFLYRMRPLAGAPEPGAIVLAAIGPAPLETAQAVMLGLAAKNENWLRLNFWLCIVITRDGEKFRYYLLGAKANSDVAADVARVRTDYPDTVQFYTLAPE